MNVVRRVKRRPLCQAFDDRKKHTRPSSFHLLKAWFQDSALAVKERLAIGRFGWLQADFTVVEV
jgi:hypothetical protein